MGRWSQLSCRKYVTNMVTYILTNVAPPPNLRRKEKFIITIKKADNKKSS